MSGKRDKVLRRAARRAIQRDVRMVCTEHFNTLCDQSFGNRVRTATRIVFRRKGKA